jgi:prepilin-type N-terminal cleavage/methylation domain-containing protein
MFPPHAIRHLRPMKKQNGYSLIELTIVMMLTALLLGMATAPIGHARDVMSVRAARGDLASLLALTRATAVMTGGAALVVDVAAGAAWIEQSPGLRVGDVQHIGARHDVLLTASSSRINIRYDALGIGRMSNATVRVKRGSITGTITISAYGRVRQS